jgi:DNA-binding beta-propeller fold protein YncE
MGLSRRFFLFPALVLNLLIALFVITPASAESKRGDLAYVMDAEKKSVHAVSLVSATVVGSVTVPETPGLMVLSPDGSRLLVFERHGRTHHVVSRAKGPAILAFGQPDSLSIFDTRDMKLLARFEEAGWNVVSYPAAGWNLAEINAAWDTSGRILTILAWGKKEHSPEIVQLDVANAKIAQRLPLACETDDVNALLQISGDTGVVLYGKRETKDNPNPSHKLLFVSLTNLEQRKEIQMPGIARDLVLSPDHDHLFVLSDDSQHIKDNGQAHLHIVSVTNRSHLRSIDGGFFLSEGWSDQNSGTTLIARFGRNVNTTVFAFQGDQQKAQIEVPDVVLKFQVAPKTRRLYLLCYNSVQVIDLENLKLIGSVSTPHRKRGMWESGRRDRPPSNLALDSTEGVGVLGYEGDDELSVLDLKEFKVKGTIDIISGKRAFAAAMAVAAASGAIAGAGSAAAGVPIAPVIPAPSSPQFGSSFIDPSDQLVYILGSGFVHVADLATYKRIKSIKIGLFPSYGYIEPSLREHKLLFIAGVDIGFVSTSYRMAVVDMAAKDTLLEQKWLGHCLYPADRKYAVNFDSENFYLLDPATLSTVKTVGGFKGLRQLLLSPERGPGE